MLENVYYVSQRIAVAALVPSIIYLAVQVRQNTAQARANANYQFLEASGQINTVLMENKETASVMRRGLEKPDALDEDDRFRFLMYVGQFLQVYSTTFDLHAQQMLPPSQWRAVRKDLITVLSPPGGRWCWNKFAKEGLTPDFVAYANALLASGEESYSIT